MEKLLVGGRSQESEKEIGEERQTNGETVGWREVTRKCFPYKFPFNHSVWFVFGWDWGEGCGVVWGRVE